MKRRDFVVGSAVVAGAALSRSGDAAAQLPEEAEAPIPHTHRPAEAAPPAQALRPERAGGSDDRYRSVITPNGRSLPFSWVGETKVFHLVAEPVHNVFCDGLEAACWGYNGSTPGPTIEVVEGDHVRIYVTNRLPEKTTVHWHGMLVPAGMDGVGGLNQPPIEPGQTFVYEFDIPEHPATFMYHPHWDEMVQIGMGLMGLFIVHPRRPRGPQADRDFAILLSEWSVPAGAARPNTLAVDFNIFTMNSKVFPGTDPLVARQGERVRIRFGNLSAIDNHPIHLHGYSFRITSTDGGAIPRSAQWPETTVLVPIGATRDIEFDAVNPGDWAMHCHMTHHIMNQMGHDYPNTIGADFGRTDERIRRLVPGYMTMMTDGMGDMGEMDMPVPENSIPMRGGPGAFGRIDMGGMFTIVKVHPNLTSYEDPGWYEHPPGTVARPARPEELEADGIRPDDDD